MEGTNVAQVLGVVAAALVAAKVGAEIAVRLKQPAVLGELLAGVLLGGSFLGWVDPSDRAIHVLAELGVALLLFEIGLETDLRKLFAVGSASMTVAAAGVVLPFLGGYAVSRAFGLEATTAIVVGASLTATSVGIVGRVLSDLGRLQGTEGQIVLGAAVIDDVLGLVILSLIQDAAGPAGATIGGAIKAAALAFGFIIVALVVGGPLTALVLRSTRIALTKGGLVTICMAMAFGAAVLADAAGSAPIIGAFCAGTLLGMSDRAKDIEKHVESVSPLLVPLFFVTAGASLKVSALNPTDPAARWPLFFAIVLLLVACATKFAAGYAPYWVKGNKALIGAAMIPRGEVGIIFAQIGHASGKLDEAQFAAVMLMVAGTTFLAPPLLRWLGTRKTE